MKRIYLAGPMSGLPDLNFPAFNAEAARLRALGYDVVNPAEINPGANVVPFDEMSEEEKHQHWCAAMKADIPQMLTCDAVALLAGWGESKGGRIERYLASELGLDVYLSADIADECQYLTADEAILLRARHWANTAKGIEKAQGPDAKREAILAHETMGKLLRDAVLAAEGGVA